MVAAFEDDIENVRALLLAGARVDFKDEDGDTAWDLTDEQEIEDLLVSYGYVPTESKARPTADDDDDDELTFDDD